MNLINYPLERFLTWLTGGDHRVSVVIDEYIADAIRLDDPEGKTACITVMTSGCVVLSWADAPQLQQSQVELTQDLLAALACGDMSKAKQIQDKMKGINK